MRRVALIVGAGDATGGALARRFAREGMVVAIARRARHADKLQELAASINASGGAAHAMPVDARVESDVVDLVRRCEELGELELVVHNIGANVRFAAHETTERVFRKVWELACLSAFLVGREGSKPMAQRGRGTLIFTGATASVRGASPSPPSPPAWRANVRSRRVWRRSSDRKASTWRTSWSTARSRLPSSAV